MSEVLVVLCTFPDAEQARQIGTLLVERQLVACVNLLPGVQSIYRWQGVVQNSAETLAIFKTTSAIYSAFEMTLMEMHPYEVPEVVALSPEAVASHYHAWWVSQIGLDKD